MIENATLYHRGQRALNMAINDQPLRNARSGRQYFLEKVARTIRDGLVSMNQTMT